MRRERRSAPPWLRLAAVCVVLVAVPIGVYLFLYQQSRIEAATIRNFRALDAAADRVEQVLVRLSNVVEGSAFGVSPTMLDEVTERLTGRKAACASDPGFGRSRWHAPPTFPPDLLQARRPMPGQRLEFRYWLAAYTLFESNRLDDGATEGLWNQLHCLLDTHRKFSEPGETVTVDVEPMPRMALTPKGPLCAGGAATPGCIRLRELLEAEPCASATPRLAAGGDGMAATLDDCRRIEERSSDLHRALKSFTGSDAVIRAVDLFGARSAADLDELMNEATGYLSRFFDSHLITDGAGRVLFEADTRSVSGTELDESHVATPGFSSFVDISELVGVESPPSAGSGAGAAASNGRAGTSAPSVRGRSFVRVVGVEEIDLRVFVHPFVLDGVAVSDGARTGPAPSNGAARASRPTFYLVGVVDDPEFRSAAIRLRLGRVTVAALALLGLLTLTPLLWFWTAGERVVVGRLALLGVALLPVVGVVLFTVLACVAVTNRADEHVLDDVVEDVSERIVDLFDLELGREISFLEQDVPRLLVRADREEPRRRGQMRLSRTADSGGAALTALETAFYCDDADRDLDYDPDMSEGWSAFLLDDDGRQRVCLSEPRRARPARNPALDLQFRDYFKRPKEGALWRSRPRSRGLVRCRGREAQDEESLIPCLVDGLREPWKRPFGVAGAPPRGPGGVEAPYFIERVDSVVGGRVATMLAVAAGRPETPVAAAQVSLNALEHAVPPRHVDFAVVDRETGRTLFHSDDDLAMTTNFVEDTGRDPALWSLLRSGARDTIGIAYAGIPVRAHVRPLRPGMPWMLVVYRGHEIEDRLAGLTAALAILSTLASLFLAALSAGIALLAAHWARPGSLPGVPAVLGRVMGAGSRLAGPAIVTGAAVLVLFGGAWLSWLAGVLEGGWPLPSLAAGSVAAVTVLAVGCTVRPRASTAGDRHGPGGAQGPGASSGDGDTTTGDGRRSARRRGRPSAGDGDKDHAMRRVVGLAMLVATVAALPSVLWFVHHRAALGVGLNHYLMDATLDSVDRAREDYRVERLRRHGAGAAPAIDRARRRWLDEPPPEPGWVHRALRPVLALSELSNELMTYRARPPAGADRVASLHGVFARTFGYGIEPPPGLFSARDFGRLLGMALGSLAFAALLAAHAYTICAACTVVGRRRRGLAKLPGAQDLEHWMGDRSDREPLRAIVLHRGGRSRGDVVKKRTERLRLWPSDSHVDGRADGSPPLDLDWVPEAVACSKKVIHCATSQRTTDRLYVFGDLQEVLEDGPDGRTLLDELERRLDRDSHVLIWSRVVPDYRYSDGSGSSDGWFDRGHSDDADRRDRWRRVAREFRCRVLDDPAALEKRFDELAGVAAGVDDSPPSAQSVRKAMKNEAGANPELLHATADVARDAPRRTWSSGDPRASALWQFGKGGASCFGQLWAESTRDERLQLYALARGGVLDSRRTATLSSLVNRGIVREDPETGVVELRSESFRAFIEHDVDQRELDAWRREGGGGFWRFIWPPLAIGGALGLAFLAMANPEMRATLLATLLGLLPAALPLLGGRGGGPPAGTVGAGGS